MGQTRSPLIIGSQRFPVPCNSPSCLFLVCAHFSERNRSPQNSGILFDFIQQRHENYPHVSVRFLRTPVCSKALRFFTMLCRFVSDVLHIRKRIKDLLGRAPVEGTHGEVVSYIVSFTRRSNAGNLVPL